MAAHWGKFPSSEVSVEKTSTPEELNLETKAEPEPVYIDEVSHFLLHIHLQTQFTSLSYRQPRSPVLCLQAKMDRTLALLQNADPADPTPDSAELTQLEGINLNCPTVSISLR